MKSFFFFAACCFSATAFSVQNISCDEKPYQTAELVQDEKAETYTFRHVSLGITGVDKETREVTGLYCSFDAKNGMVFQCSRSKTYPGGGAPVVRGDSLVRQTLMGKPAELKTETQPTVQFRSYGGSGTVADRDYSFSASKCSIK